MSKKLMFLIAVVFCLVACAGYYFLIFTKTPAYSIYQAYDGAKNHNVAKFEEYVDIEAVYGNAYDQIAEKTVSKNPTLDQIFGGIKGSVVAKLSDQARKAIAGKKQDPVADAQNQAVPEKKKTNILDILNISDDVKAAQKKYMERHLNFKYMRFKDVTTTERADGSTIVTGKFHDIQVDKDFYLKLKMEPKDNGQWKVTQVMNVVDLALERDKAAMEKLASLNKQIRDEMGRLFVVKDAKAEVKKSGGIIPTSKFTYTIAYCLPDKNKRIAEVEGEFIMLNQQGQIAQREDLNITGLVIKYAQAGYSSDKVFTETWTKRDVLGSIFGRERGIAAKGAENYTCQYALNKLVLADGKVLEALKDLPVPEK